MSIIGQSFTGDTTGARVNFDVGNAANVFTGAFTIVCLAKFTSQNWGMIGGYSDSVGGTAQGQMFISSNSGGRLYSIGDFSNGTPDPADVASPGLSDGVWRWHAVSKPAGSAPYRMHYADLATLTWVHRVSTGAANHNDMSAVVVFSTWALYALGFDSGDMAALAVFDSELSDSAIAAACTQLASDLAGASPAAGWLFPEATAGSAVSDFTGGGANETGRQLVATSADPADFDMTISTDATINASTIAATAALPAAAVRARQSLLTTQTPALPDQTDGGAAGITTATTMTFDTAGNVVGIRFRATTNVNTANTYTAELWRVTDNVSGVLLASKAVSGLVITAGTWNVIEFDTPVAVDAAHAYRAAINNNDSAGGKYVASPGFFTAAGLTNGHITAIRGGSVVFGLTLSNGVFAQNSTPGTYPSDQFGEALYFVDVVYQIAGGNTDATVHPSVIAAVASLPAATESAGATVAPAVVAVAATTPAAGARAGSTVTPAVVAAVAAVPGGHVRVGTQLVYTRLGGVLVPTSLRGVVRLDGASVEFG